MYDYVIVGAGSAGCVIAGRLSEDRDVRVALLEAGGQDGRPEIAMPIAFPMLLKSSVDWDLYGEQEPGLGGRRLFLPRGKVLGGSGSINAMIYIRGNRADYDGWAAGGAQGWSYDEVLPYFKRSEDNERGEDGFHGVGGPLSVADSRAMSPLIETMLEAAELSGLDYNPDFNGARQEGVGRFQLTQRNGRRHSTAAAFIHPVETRPNLDVITDALALRILFEGTRAVGVEVSRNGVVEQVRREREVILSAGAYQSPVLLMISGIGPAEDLAPLRHGGAREPAGRPQPAGPLHVPAQLRDRRAVAVRGVRGRQLRAVRGRGTRSADVQHPRGRRLLPHADRDSKRPTCSSTSPRRCSTTRG